MEGMVKESVLGLVVAGLLIALTHTSSDAASDKTARDKNGLVGPVRMVTTKLSLFSVTENYDRAGNLIEAVTYSEYDKTSTRHVFAYNQKGNLQEETAYDGDGVLIYRKIFAYGYDSSGHETAVVAASQDGVFNHAEFSIYDEKGYLSEVSFFAGSSIYRNVLDVQGHIVYSARFNNRQLLSETKWSYDSNGRLIELLSYGPTGTVTGKTVYEHDDSGKRAREITERYEQDAAGKLVTTYEYDSTGNWIKERKEAGGSSESATTQPQIVQERVIVYYEIR